MLAMLRKAAAGSGAKDEAGGAAEGEDAGRRDDEEEGEDEDCEVPLAPEQEQKLDERLAWRTNAPVLYDLFISCTLEWPALSVAWLPDEPDEGCRLAIGLHTDGSMPHEVIVAELCCNVESRIAADPWNSWAVEGLGEAEGFGCSASSGSGPLRPIARLRHPTEVNRVAPCPHRPQLLASKVATGEVLLYDYKKERPADQVVPDASLAPSGSAVDGFALSWSSLQRHLLASGGNDGRLAVWDVEVAPQARAGAPLFEVMGHKGALCDAAFSRLAPSLLASVGDDGALHLWDARAARRSPQLAAKASKDEVLSVDWSFRQEHLLATAGKDKLVCVWDARAASKPLRELRGHKQEAVVVRWAPFREDLLGSCSSEGRLHIWDLAAKQDAEPEEDAEPDEAPELLFAHGGHTEAISDFSWSGVDDFLLCSVSEDNGLHIWQPSTVFYLDSADEADVGGMEAEEEAPAPADKRRRSQE